MLRKGILFRKLLPRSIDFIYIYIYIYIYIHIHTYIPTYLHAYQLTYMHTYLQIKNICVCVCIQVLIYVSNLKLKTIVFCLFACFLSFFFLLAMAPKRTSTGNSSDRKRSRCSIKDFIPVENPPAELDNEHAEAVQDENIAEAVEVADKIAPFLACKEENNDDEDATSEKNILRASKGQGMNPLEVSRMTTMLAKRRKKDHACLGICIKYVFAYLLLKFMSLHLFLSKCVYILY